MERMIKCRVCGEEFTTTNNRQRFCSYKCRYEAQKEREAKKSSSPAKTYPDIYDMVDAMMKLSKERGRVVQNGEVQRMILTGRLKVVGGRIIC